MARFVQKQQWLARPSWLSEHRPCGLSSSFPVSSKVNTSLCVQIRVLDPPLSQFTHNVSLLPRSNLLTFFDRSILFNTALEFSFHWGGCFQIERKTLQWWKCQSFLWWYCQAWWNRMRLHLCLRTHDSSYFSQQVLQNYSQNDTVTKTISFEPLLWLAKDRGTNPTVCWLLVGHGIQTQTSWLEHTDHWSCTFSLWLTGYGFCQSDYIIKYVWSALYSLAGNTIICSKT